MQGQTLGAGSSDFSVLGAKQIVSVCRVMSKKAEKIDWIQRVLNTPWEV